MPVLNVDIETMMNELMNARIECIYRNYMMDELMNACIGCIYRNYDEWVDKCLHWMYIQKLWWMSWWMPVLNADIETMMNELMNACIECIYRNYDEWVDECLSCMYI